MKTKHSVLPIRNALLAALMLAGSAVFATASAATLELESSASTYIRSDKQNTNYGGDAEIWVGQLAGGGAAFRSLLAFDLSSLPDDAVITSVTATLYQVAEDGSSYVYSNLDAELHLTDSFDEDTVTWATAGTFSEDVLSSAEVSLRNLDLPVTVTWASTQGLVDALQGAYASESQIVNFLLKSSDEESIYRQIAKFSSDEGAASYVAKLSIEYTVIPEPSSMTFVVLAALLGTLVMRKRL